MGDIKLVVDVMVEFGIFQRKCAEKRRGPRAVLWKYQSFQRQPKKVHLNHFQAYPFV